MKILKIILFIVLTCFICFCGGMLLGGYVSRNTIGLDAYLKALEYGMAGVVFGLVSGLLMVRLVNALWFHRLFITVCIVSAVIGILFSYRMVYVQGKFKTASTSRKAREDSVNFLYRFAGNFSTSIELPVGTGVAQPHLNPELPLYFYGYNAIYALPGQIVPADSVVFEKGPHYIDIASAPPYLVPEILKLDYDAFYLRTLTVTKNWLEVVVNNTTGQTAWISRTNADFFDWHEFLLNVVAVELIDEVNNPIRLKPLDKAGVLITPMPRFQLQPLAVQGDWLMVSTNGLADRIQPAGWIRWRDGDKMLIKYSILG